MGGISDGHTIATGSAVAIIPARGGSKGILRKNLRRIGGRELVARAVDVCNATASIKLVVVSTDDEEIASVSRQSGATVIMRPQELASDIASSEAALLHALDELEQRNCLLPSTTVFVQCTSPFIRANDLDDAIGRLHEHGADTVLSVAESHRFIWREHDGALVGVNHIGGPRKRRQDLGIEYAETGAFYVMRTEKFRRRRQRFMDRTVGFEVPEWTAIEIDTEVDLRIAESLAHLDASSIGDLSGIAALVTDFDGVHTDDTAYVCEDGREHVKVSRSDGMGISMLRDAGLPILILSKERNPVVSRRAEKLRVDVRQGVDNKLPAVIEWISALGIPPQKVAYVGNDVNDLACMNYVGWPIAVADAAPDVVRVARHVLKKRGGHGALRELGDLLMAAGIHSESSSMGQLFIQPS